jgi:hypothetical protein
VVPPPGAPDGPAALLDTAPLTAEVLAVVVPATIGESVATVATTLVEVVADPPTIEDVTGPSVLVVINTAMDDVAGPLVLVVSCPMTDDVTGPPVLVVVAPGASLRAPLRQQVST